MSEPDPTIEAFLADVAANELTMTLFTNPETRGGLIDASALSDEDKEILKGENLAALRDRIEAAGEKRPEGWTCVWIV
jgi:hypothetical protein